MYTRYQGYMIIGIFLNMFFTGLSSWSEEIPELVFGPLTYGTESSQQCIYNDIFHVCTTQGKYMLLCEVKGIPGKVNYNASILLNQNQVLDFKEFSNLPKIIVKPVKLKKQNRIRIIITCDKVFNLTISIFCLDCMELYSTYPSDGQKVDDNKIMVSGYFRSSRPIEAITINSHLAWIKGDNFYLYPVYLDEGDNLIHMVITDRCGMTETKVIKITLPSGYEQVVVNEQEFPLFKMDFSEK